MRVRATQIGYYNNKRIREGEEFELRPAKGKVWDAQSKTFKEELLTPERLFSSKWMEKVDGVKPATKPAKKQEPVYEDEEVI
jgi:hypothetical protein